VDTVLVPGERTQTDEVSRMGKQRRNTQQRQTGRRTGRRIASTAFKPEPPAPAEIAPTNILKVHDEGRGQSHDDHQHKERIWLWYVATGAAVIALVLFSLFVFKLTSTIELENQQLIAGSRAYQDLQSRFVELRNEEARTDEFLRMLSPQHVRITALQGFGKNPPAYGKIFWATDQHGALLQVTNLPSVPQGKTYQVWLLGGPKPISAGTFVVKSGGSTFYCLDSVAALARMRSGTIAVTLEQDGGASKPSGAVYLRGPFAQ
jgi:hypothetical protein